MKRRNAIKGAFFSEYIDMFDIYLPVVVLSPVLVVLPAAASVGRHGDDSRIAGVYHHAARTPDRRSDVRHGRRPHRPSQGVDLVGVGLWRRHAADRAAARAMRASASRRTGLLVLLRFVDGIFSRRRLHRGNAACDRVFEEGAARLCRRPHHRRVFPWRTSRSTWLRC